MARTQVPEEEQRVKDLGELKNGIAPTKERVAFVESDADGDSNYFWWDPSGEASNADGVTKVASNVKDSGLWKRTYLKFVRATTEDLAEGSTNLYYTSRRARSEFSAKNGLTYNPTSGTFTGKNKGSYELSSVEGAAESSLDVTNAPEGITYNSDGSKIYTCLNGEVREYNSTGYDITTASLNNTEIFSEDNDWQAVFFNRDGSKLFLGGDETEKIYEYTLGVAYDISTANYNNASLDVSGEIDSLRGAALSNDGKKFYGVDYSSGIAYSYTLGTAFDVSTGSPSGSKLEIPTFSSITDLEVGDKGNRFYFASESGNVIYEVFTTTPYDLTQGALNYKLSRLSGTPVSVGASDGNTLHYGDKSNSKIVQKDFGYHIYGQTNLEGQLSALRSNTSLRLSSSKTSLDSSTLVRMQAETSESKPAVGWWDQDGRKAAALVAYEKLDADTTDKQWSIQTVDSTGSLQPRMKFPYGSDVITVQTQNAGFKVSAGYDFTLGTSGGADSTADLYGDLFVYGDRDVGLGDKDWTAEGLEATDTNLEVYRSSSTSQLLIHQGDGTSDAALYLKSGAKNWRIKNVNSDLVYAEGGAEKGRLAEGGIFTVSDAYVRRFKRVSSDASTSGHEYYSVDTSQSEVTLTLSSADEVDGRVIHVKRDGINKVTVNTGSSATIEKASTTPQLKIARDLDAVKFVYNKTTNNWEIF